MGHFKKGLFLGGLVGAGIMWLSATKKGKEMRDRILDSAAEVYKEVETKVKATDQWKRMSKNAYLQMVREAVDRYAVRNGLAAHIKDMVVKLVSAQWKHLEREMKKKK